MSMSRWYALVNGRLRAGGARFLILVLLALILFDLAAPSPMKPALAATNPIVTENQQPGTGAWLIGSQQSTDATGQIKGYASATSVYQNQSIAISITTNPAQTYTIDFYRIGWYGGVGGRFRLHVGPLDGTTQPTCPTDPNTGLIACNWTPSYTLTVPGDWTTGTYVALLTNAQGYQNYVLFVVKDGRAAPLLYQEAVTTYEAYNNYPNDGLTGKSLYTYNSYGANTVAGDPRAVKVSFDRPYTANGSGQFFYWEVYFVRWLERNGYDVTYTTDVDTHANGGALLNSKGFLSVAHDEYWSKEMLDAAQAARDAGVNVGFFTADAAFWQIRFETSASGAANRVIVCYKNATIDPVQGPTTTVEFRDPPVNRPEQTLEGVQFTSSIAFGGTVPYVVTNSSSWVYAGTGSWSRGLENIFPGDQSADPRIQQTTANVVNALINGAPIVQKLTMSAPASTTAGQSFTVSVTAANSQGNPVATYQGAVHFSSSDGQAVLPSDYTFTSADAGVHQFSVTLKTAGNQTANVVDTVNAGLSATVTLRDQFGNVATGYRGTVHFTSTDLLAQTLGDLPADYTFTNGDAGTHTFSVTLATVGNQTITVADMANSTLNATSPPIAVGLL